MSSQNSSPPPDQDDGDSGSESSLGVKPWQTLGPSSPQVKDESEAASMSERADAEDAPDGPAHEYKTVFDGRIEKTKEYMRSLHQRFDSVGWESDTMMPVIPWLGLVSDGSVYVVFAQSIKQRRVSRNGITNIDRDAIVTADGVELRVVCPMLLHADTAAALQSFYDSVIRVNTRDWLLLCSRPRVMDQQDNLGLTIIPASDVTKVVLVEHQTIRTPEMQAKFGTRSPQPGCTDFLEALINGKAAQFIALTKVHAFEHLKKAIIKQEKEVEKTAAASAAASTTAAGAAAAAAAATAQGLKNTAMPPPPKPDSLQSLAPPPPGGFPVGVSCWHHAIGRRRTSAVIMERSHDGTRYRVQISNRETWVQTTTLELKQPLPPAMPSTPEQRPPPPWQQLPPSQVQPPSQPAASQPPSSQHPPSQHPPTWQQSQPPWQQPPSPWQQPLPSWQPPPQPSPWHQSQPSPQWQQPPSWQQQWQQSWQQPPPWWQQPTTTPPSVVATRRNIVGMKAAQAEEQDPSRRASRAQEIAMLEYDLQRRQNQPNKQFQHM